MSSYSSVCILITHLTVLGLRYQRELRNKISTFEQSLQKVEYICYNLKLKEAEI